MARAFLKKAPILILDEATSALDAQSESQVQEALSRLMKGRTTLIIAHRLATIQSADLICVLDKGKIVELGRHKDLIEKSDGAYRLLVQKQLSERGH
jgi:ABC-type multidrug transport system fused ATPase/permease subunit